MKQVRRSEHHGLFRRGCHVSPKAVFAPLARCSEEGTGDSRALWLHGDLEPSILRRRRKCRRIWRRPCRSKPIVPLWGPRLSKRRFTSPSPGGKTTTSPRSLHFGGVGFLWLQGREQTSAMEQTETGGRIHDVALLRLEKSRARGLRAGANRQGSGPDKDPSISVVKGIPGGGESLRQVRGCPEKIPGRLPVSPHHIAAAKKPPMGRTQRKRKSCLLVCCDVLEPISAGCRSVVARAASSTRVARKSQCTTDVPTLPGYHIPAYNSQ